MSEYKQEFSEFELNRIINRIIQATKVDNTLFKNKNYNPISTILWNESERILQENKYISEREMLDQLLIRIEPQLKLIEIEKTANQTKNIYIIKFCVVLAFLFSIISVLFLL
jgi:hypothetical protein